MKRRKSSSPKRRARSIRLDRSAWLDLAIILAVALVLRLIYTIELSGSLVYGNYLLDSMVIDRLAADIAAGGNVGGVAFFRAPLYIYLVAALYSLFGQSPTPVLVLQMLLSLATAIFTYVYGRKLCGRVVGLGAGLVIACWPTLIYFSGELMITTLAVFWVIPFLLSLHRAVDSGSWRWHLIAGIILGLASITRPTFLPLILVVPIIYLLLAGRNRWQRCLRQTSIAVAGLLLVILPVTVRNLIVADDLVLISAQGGVNFYLGNHREADGISVSMPALGPIMQAGQYQDNVWTSSVQIAEQDAGRKLKQSEVSSYWFKRGLQEMATAPGQALGLLLKKVYFFWHGQEIFNNKSPYYAGEYSLVLRFLLWQQGLNFPSGLLIPFMILGIYLGWRRGLKLKIPLLVLLIFTLTVAVFFVCSRFRQPLLPIAAILAVYGIRELYLTIRRKPASAWLPLLAIPVLFLIVLNWGGNVESRINQSQHHNVIGNLHFSRGDFGAAVLQFEQALAVDPANAQSYGSLGAAYAKSGRLADAKRVLEQAVSYHPRSSSFHFNLGLTYMQTNESAAAKEHFQTALELDPLHEMPYLGLADILEAEGEVDSARVVYQTLLRHRPDSRRAQQKLQSLGQ